MRRRSISGIAAAEYGLAVEAFAHGLEEAGGEAGQLKRRLEQGVLPREILEAEFKDLIVKVSDNEPIEITAVAAADVAKVGGKTKEEAHDFDLALTSDSTEYKVNDLPVFTIKSKEDCNLTLINVDASGEGTVIFPNKFQQDNFLPAGKELQVPRARRAVPVPPQGPWDRDGDRDLQRLRQGRPTASSTTSRSGSSPISATIATFSRARSSWTVPRRSPRARRPKRRAKKCSRGADSMRSRPATAIKIHVK